jgi:aryl-alcohol dehydrogenase-like predicted oxidoreductase
MAERRPLGASGLTVCPIGLGGMPLSLARRPPEDEAVRVIHAALDAGMDLLDTADVYCLNEHDIGHNERLIARALRERPSAAVVVATKGGFERPGGRWVANGRPDHLRRACDASLRALNLAVISLYQLHRPDPHVPLEDSVGTLAELRSAGKILHVGLSNVTVPQIEAARVIVPIASVQNRCNPFDRTPWQDGTVALCEEHGIAFLPYSPVGGMRDRERVGTDPVLNAVARRHGATPYEVVLAWVLARSPVMLPIPGASRVASARSSASATNLVLTPADLAELERKFPTQGTSGLIGREDP